MLAIVQIWHAQTQEVIRPVGATSRRIAFKIAKVIPDGKTARIAPTDNATKSAERVRTFKPFPHAPIHAKAFLPNTKELDRLAGPPFPRIIEESCRVVEGLHAVHVRQVHPGEIRPAGPGRVRRGSVPPVGRGNGHQSVWGGATCTGAGL